MSREIKFRAWAKQNNKMIDLKAITPLALDKGVLDEGDGLFIPFREDIELMQYTGLKDKNGKDIYEGDIISKNGKGVHQVYYDAAMFLVKYETDSWSLSHIRNEDLEVIGDIYQNPELLK